MLILDTDINLYNFLSLYDKSNQLEISLADKNEQLYDYCERIIKKNPETVLINTEAAFENSSHASLKALDLLYWLRCKYGFKKTILLCGFLSLDKIRLLRPKYSIIDSEGITYFRLPFNLEKAKLKIDTNEISNSNLLEHANSMFYLKQARHEDANWWAMKTLLDCHSLKNNVVYPRIVIEKEKQLNNALASFIFRSGNTYEENLKKLLQENYNKDSNFKDPKQIEKEALERQITIYKNLIHSTKKRYEKENYRLQITSLKSKLEVIDKKSNILMIDDKAEEGWKNVQEQVIGASKNIDIIAFDFSQEKTLSKLVDDLWKKIDDYLNEKCNLLDFIFLDLMLFPNNTKHDIVEQYSGLRILKLIKDKYRQIPILITSASNKIWNYQLAISYGADAYWIKEGIESNYEFNDAIINYNRLLDLTKSFTSLEYSTLRRFREINNRSFQKSGSFWWTNKKWSELNIETKKEGISYSVPKQQLVDKQSVFEYLLSFSKLLHFYINEVIILKKILSNKDKQSHFASLSIIIGKIIELIHPGIRGENNKYLTTGAIIRIRGDKLGSELYNLRNSYSHNSLRKVHTDSFFTKLLQFYSYLFEEEVFIDNGVKDQWKTRIDEDEEILKQKNVDKLNSKEKESKESQPEEKQKINKHKEILDRNEIDYISSFLNEEKAIERIEIYYKN